MSTFFKSTKFMGDFLRIDKFLKVSRLIKRRTIANEACDSGKIFVNGKQVKASYNVSVNDIITIDFGTKTISVKVINVKDSTKKQDALTMYEIV